MVTVQLPEVIVSLRGAVATKQSKKDCFAKNARNDTSRRKTSRAELLLKMALEGLKEKATKWGIKSSRMVKKADLIRLIQSAEGNFPCFGTAKDFCDQMSCSWRGDCLSE